MLHKLKDRISLLKRDLFDPVGDAIYDIVLANPPYVFAKALAELPLEISHETRVAIEGGSDGLDIVR